MDQVIAQALRQFGLTVALVLGILLAVWFMSGGQDARTNVIIVAIAVVWILLFVLWVRGMRKNYVDAGDCPSAAQHLDAHLQANPDFCLVLRPFGADHAMQIANLSLELRIEDHMRRRLGCGTLALIDPRHSLVHNGVSYLSAGRDDWRVTVDTLVSRALLIILLIPPYMRLGPSVRWELQCIERHAVGSRLLIVLPAPDRLGAAQARRSLRQVADVFAADPPKMAIGIQSQPFAAPRYHLCTRIRPKGWWLAFSRGWSAVVGGQHMMDEYVRMLDDALALAAPEVSAIRSARKAS